MVVQDYDAELAATDQLLEVMQAVEVIGAGRR
jgi:hypothetical protein